MANTDKNQLLQDFIIDYQRSFEDPSVGPDPTVDELVDTEDGLSAALLPLHLPELEQVAQADLKGKRTTDMPDMMLETADGLRACQQIAALVSIEPEFMENTVLLDTGLGGLIQVLQTLAGRADTDQLLRAGEGDAFCQDIDDQIAAIPGDRGRQIHDQFAEAMARRQQGLNGPTAAAAATRAELRPHQEQLKTAQHQADMEGYIRDLVVAALEQTPVTAKLTKKKATAATLG